MSRSPKKAPAKASKSAASPKSANSAKPEPEKVEGSIKPLFLGWYGVVGLTLSYITPVKVPFAEGYAKEYWRHVLGSLLLVLLLIGGLIGTAFYLLDANDFKDQIVSYVKTHKQRDLVIEGDLNLTYFPSLGLDTGKMSLSQRNSTRPFASMENARLYVAWWPLLLKQVRIERIVVDRVQAQVTRHKNGSTDIDDLLASDGRLSDIVFEIEKLRVLESTLTFKDEASARLFNLNDVDLELSHLKDKESGRLEGEFRLAAQQPHIDARVKLTSHLQFDRVAKRFELLNLEARAQGEAAGVKALDLTLHGASLATMPTQTELGKLTADIKGVVDTRRIEARAELGEFKLAKGRGQGAAFSLKGQAVQGEERWAGTLELPVFDMADGQLQAANTGVTLDLAGNGATLLGKLTTQLLWRHDERELRLAAIDTRLDLNHPALRSKVELSGSGEFRADIDQEEAALNVKARLGDSEFITYLQAKDFKQPAYRLDLSVNTLDADRYLAIDWGKRLRPDAPAFDFSALQGRNLRGKIYSSGEFKLANLKTNRLSAELRADASGFHLEDVQAQLYGGNVTGSLSVGSDAGSRISWRQKLQGVQFDALLADLLGGEPRLGGRGQLALELNAEGRTPATLRKTLAGTASLALTRGALAGMNLEEALVASKAELGHKDAVRQDNARLTENTPFNELKATFDVVQGHARNGDLLLKAASYSGKGEGEIALDSGQIKYRFNASVSNGLRRATDGELADLSGITVPLDIGGTTTSPTIALQLGQASGPGLLRLAKAAPSPGPAASSATGKSGVR